MKRLAQFLIQNLIGFSFGVSKPGATQKENEYGLNIPYLESEKFAEVIHIATEEGLTVHGQTGLVISCPAAEIVAEDEEASAPKKKAPTKAATKKKGVK